MTWLVSDVVAESVSDKDGTGVTRQECDVAVRWQVCDVAERWPISK